VRVVAHRSDAEYWTEPFPVSARRGVRVVLHGHPSSKDLSDARILFQTMVLVEADGADVRVTQARQVYDVGPRRMAPRQALAPPDGRDALREHRLQRDLAPDHRGGRSRGVLLGNGRAR
jgi:hypothetical protein